MPKPQTRNDLTTRLRECGEAVAFFGTGILAIFQFLVGHLPQFAPRRKPSKVSLRERLAPFPGDD